MFAIRKLIFSVIFTRRLIISFCQTFVFSSADPVKPSPILDEDIGQTKAIVEFINKKTLSNGNPVRLVSECSRFVYLFIYLFNRFHHDYNAKKD